MELIKRKDNFKNPASTAMKNYRALAFLLILFTLIIFINYSEIPYIYISVFLYISITAYLINKIKILGIYLGYIFIIFGLLNATINLILHNDYTSILSILIIGYIAYWNYKAHIYIKNKI